MGAIEKVFHVPLGMDLYIRPYCFHKDGGYAKNHPVRLCRRVQTQCNRPSVSVLDISPPQEGNDLLLPVYKINSALGWGIIVLRCVVLPVNFVLGGGWRVPKVCNGCWRVLIFAGLIVSRLG